MKKRRLSAAILAALVCLWQAAGAAADEPKLPDVKAFDKQVIDSLREVHNRGADMYNSGRDFIGTYRLYQGALETVRPLLGHRPEVQKLIEAGLAAADKADDTARRAFLLHDTIESVRKSLKTAISSPTNPPPLKIPDDKKPDGKKTDDVKKPDPEKKPETMKKPEPENKPVTPVKPAALPTAPPPHEMKPR